MALFRISGESFERVPETTFATEKLQERQDLQRLLKADISVIDAGLMVVAEEFGDWEDSSRRIDLLCLDTDANIVVVEIKRTDDGGHMELQALRYAAMVSSMTFDQVVSAHGRYIGSDEPAAQAAVLQHLGWETSADEALSGNVRIVLVAGNFSREITTAVLWLNKQGLDITCYKLRPHKLEEELLVDIQQLIPLPEAAEYETKLRAQRQETERVESARRQIFRRFWAQLIERSKGRTSVVANRTASRDHWLAGRIGRAGFELNFVLTKQDSQVECYMRFREGPEKAAAAFEQLLVQRSEIEAAFGGPLVWEDLPGRLGCRISCPVQGGWRTPETEWPEFQDRLIDAMARLEKALRGPIQTLVL